MAGRDSIEEHGRHILHGRISCCTLRFGSTAKVLAKCKLKHYRISKVCWGHDHLLGPAHPSPVAFALRKVVD